MKAYVGVTNGDWYRFLADRPALNEVNFWRPSGGRGFGVLTPGEPFFFKTHYPHNRVVGGGFYSGFAPLPISAAWELFGEGNGVDGLAQMRARVGKYRRQLIAAGEDPEIGCVFVRDTVFFPPDTLADSHPTPWRIPTRHPGGPAAPVLAQHRAGQELRPSRPCGVRLLRGPAGPAARPPSRHRPR